MTPRKTASGGSKAAKKTTAKGSTAKKSSAKKSTAKKAAARKPAAKKTTAKKATPQRKSNAKAAAKKAAPKKATARKTTARKTTTKATTAKKATASKPTSGRPQRKTSVVKQTAAKPARAPRPAKLDAETLKQIKATLETERADLEHRMQEIEEATFVATQSELTGEVGLDEDFADAGTATFDRERDLSIRNNIQDLIEQITRALRRIDDGTYGTCERCGQPIDAARVKALPHASLCLDCKRREERTR
jgi:RNA polymerase-binding protein DksA